MGVGLRGGSVCGSMRGVSLWVYEGGQCVGVGL